MDGYPAKYISFMNRLQMDKRRLANKKMAKK